MELIKIGLIKMLEMPKFWLIKPYIKMFLILINQRGVVFI